MRCESALDDMSHHGPAAFMKFDPVFRLRLTRKTSPEADRSGPVATVQK